MSLAPGTKHTHTHSDINAVPIREYHIQQPIINMSMIQEYQKHTPKGTRSEALLCCSTALLSPPVPDSKDLCLQHTKTGHPTRQHSIHSTLHALHSLTAQQTWPNSSCALPVKSCIPCDKL
jgi:hypothetical protein